MPGLNSSSVIPQLPFIVALQTMCVQGSGSWIPPAGQTAPSARPTPARWVRFICGQRLRFTHLVTSIGSMLAGLFGSPLTLRRPVHASAVRHVRMKLHLESSLLLPCNDSRQVT